MYSSGSGFEFLIKLSAEVAVLFYFLSNMARGNFKNSEIGKDRIFKRKNSLEFAHG